MKDYAIVDTIQKTIIPAVPIPFRKDGTIDFASQQSFIEWMNTQDVQMVALWAHTGRGCYLSKTEREQVFAQWRDYSNKAILCGAGSLPVDDDDVYMQKALDMAHHACDLGADMLLPYAPALFKGRDQQDELILKYHKKIAEIGLPMVLFYLYEEAGGISYSEALIQELFALPQVIGIKMATLDSVMTFQDVSNMVLDYGNDKMLITGEDRMFGYTLMRGSSAALVGIGSVYTSLQSQMMQAYYDKNYEKFMAKSLQVDHLSEVTFCKPMEGYIERMLYILGKKGIIDKQATYDPYGPGITDDERYKIDQVMHTLGDM